MIRVARIHCTGGLSQRLGSSGPSIAAYGRQLSSLLESQGYMFGRYQGNHNTTTYARRQPAFFSTKAFSGRDPGLNYTCVISDPKEVEGPTPNIPSRAEQLRRLQKDDTVFDFLVIGGGATGAGIALDAAARGLNVACIERGDFALETSSRSTKLIWAGLKYMATASAALLSKKLFTEPIATIKEFMGEMEMVLECHKERKYMTVQQRHLCNWVPYVS